LMFGRCSIMKALSRTTREYSSAAAVVAMLRVFRGRGLQAVQQAHGV